MILAQWGVMEKKIFKFRQCIFCNFVIITSWKRAWAFIWTNLNALQPRMHCCQFGWNWPSGSWGEVENRKSLQSDGQTDDGQKAIRKAHLSFQLRWVKKIQNRRRLRLLQLMAIEQWRFLSLPHLLWQFWYQKIIFIYQIMRYSFSIF